MNYLTGFVFGFLACTLLVVLPLVVKMRSVNSGNACDVYMRCVDGHEYLIAERYSYGVSALHAASCPCLQETKTKESED